jgi:hypothetical protein
MAGLMRYGVLEGFNNGIAPNERDDNSGVRVTAPIRRPDQHIGEQSPEMRAMPQNRRHVQPMGTPPPEMRAMPKNRRAVNTEGPLQPGMFPKNKKHNSAPLVLPANMLKRDNSAILGQMNDYNEGFEDNDDDEGFKDNDEEFDDYDDKRKEGFISQVFQNITKAGFSSSGFGMSGPLLEGFEDEKKAEKKGKPAPVAKKAELAQPFKLGEIPSQSKKGPHIDAGATLVKAIEALNPDQINAMTKDTKQLIETQKSLMGMLGTMKPMMNDGKELMETFQEMFGKQ